MPEPVTAIVIAIQESDFNQHDLYCDLRRSTDTGAIVTFTGLVREFVPSASASIYLEHYPVMTERVLQKIAEEALKKWPLQAITVVHRVGELQLGEQIVFVGTASSHRLAAFDGCHFIIDYLKTQAPFWKKEGTAWVEAKTSDQFAVQHWLNTDA